MLFKLLHQIYGFPSRFRWDCCDILYEAARNLFIRTGLSELSSCSCFICFFLLAYFCTCALVCVSVLICWLWVWFKLVSPELFASFNIAFNNVFSSTCVITFSLRGLQACAWSGSGFIQHAHQVVVWLSYLCTQLIELDMLIFLAVTLVSFTPAALDALSPPTVTAERGDSLICDAGSATVCPHVSTWLWCTEGIFHSRFMFTP